MFKSQVKSGLDLIRNVLEVDPKLRRRFRAARSRPDYQEPFEKKTPLVSVCIGTYNRARLLTERCLPSILSQTYTNLEILVVGDCCTDNTQERVDRLGDRRILFHNLPERGRYPKHPKLQWMVAGTASINAALRLATGDFITHLDDDDEHMPDRVERLLEFVRDRRADLAFHPFYAQAADASWYLRDGKRFEFGTVTTSSIFYHRWLARIEWNPNAYLWYEPGDWNRARKFKYLGVRVARYPEPLLRHYKERAQAPADS